MTVKREHKQLPRTLKAGVRGRVRRWKMSKRSVEDRPEPGLQSTGGVSVLGGAAAELGGEGGRGPTVETPRRLIIHLTPAGVHHGLIQQQSTTNFA